MQITVLHNRKDKIDPKVQKLESDIRENLTVTCRENFNEYLYNSSLHGLRYVGDRTISRWERYKTNALNCERIVQFQTQ